MNAPRCPYAASGCNSPEGECLQLCLSRLDTVIRRDLPPGPVYFTASGGCPRWTSRIDVAERFTARGAGKIAKALQLLDHCDLSLQRVA